MNRTVCLVADGLGVGETPDAHRYHDEGSNTLAHIASFVGSLKLPNLQKLGLGNLGNFSGIPANANPLACVGKMEEKSSGKDTTTGHWEIAGLVTDKPFALFPNGFPQELTADWVKECEIPGFLGNKAASGTQIIQELGEEHLRTKKPILYTSGDSVFQIAAHETVFGLEKLYKICESARKLTLPYQIGRVIARPFVGETPESFKRTENRRDYSVTPGPNLLDWLSTSGVGVYSVGKIDDIFGHRGIQCGNHTGNNLDSLLATEDFLKKTRRSQSFIFVNLVDFDMLYGHRRDPVGYARSLIELDEFLPRLLTELDQDDALILTADHGCDPTYSGTDHTREYVPLVAYRPSSKGRILGTRSSFADVARTVLDAYRISDTECPGESFLGELSDPL